MQLKSITPVLTSKAEAQAFVELNMEQLKDEKQQFLQDVVKKNWPSASYTIDQTP